MFLNFFNQDKMNEQEILLLLGILVLILIAIGIFFLDLFCLVYGFVKCCGFFKKSDQESLLNHELGTVNNAYHGCRKLLKPPNDIRNIPGVGTIEDAYEIPKKLNETTTTMHQISVEVPNCDPPLPPSNLQPISFSPSPNSSLKTQKEHLSPTRALPTLPIANSMNNRFQVFPAISSPSDSSHKLSSNSPQKTRNAPTRSYEDISEDVSKDVSGYKKDSNQGPEYIRLEVDNGEAQYIPLRNTTTIL